MAKTSDIAKAIARRTGEPWPLIAARLRIRAKKGVAKSKTKTGPAAVKPHLAFPEYTTQLMLIVEYLRLRYNFTEMKIAETWAFLESCPDGHTRPWIAAITNACRAGQPVELHFVDYAMPAGFETHAFVTLDGSLPPPPPDALVGLSELRVCILPLLGVEPERPVSVAAN